MFMHADLELIVGLAVVDEVVQAAPRAFELLEVGVVHDDIDLLAHLAVDLGDHRIDGLDHVGRDELAAGQRLLGESTNRVFHLLLGAVGLRLELLVEQRGELIHLHGCGGGLCLRVFLCLSHGSSSLLLGFWLRRSRRLVWAPPPGPAEAPGFLSTSAIRSSAPVRPSM
jgi:hypothetical protein